MDKISDEDRVRVARGWRKSGMTQAAYAASHGVTDRTLRAWLARWAPSHPASPEVVRELIEQTIERLRGLVANRDAGDGKPTPSVDVKAVETVPPAVPPRPSPAVPPRPSPAAPPTRHGTPARAVAWDMGNIARQ
jgi:transposase-like protein